MTLSLENLREALAADAANPSNEALRLFLGIRPIVQEEPLGDLPVLPPPAPLVRCIGGPMDAELDRTVGKNGIICVFLNAPILRGILLAWIAATAVKGESEIDADLATFSVFLQGHNFGDYEPIGALAAPIAVRNIFWTLLMGAPCDTTKLELALRRFSPRQFGYELGPWEHNPDVIEDFGEFLAPLPSSLANFAVGGGGGGSNEPLPENLFEPK